MKISNEGVKKIREYIDSMEIDKLEEILSKDLESLTEEDIKELYNFKKTFRTHLESVNSFQRLVNSARNEINEKIKKYTLLERSEIVSQEEENNLEENQILIDEVNKKIEEKGFGKLLSSVEQKEIEYDKYKEFKKEENKRKEIKEAKAKIKDFILSRDTSNNYGWKEVLEPVKDSYNNVSYRKIYECPISEKVMKLINDYNAFEEKYEPKFVIIDYSGHTVDTYDTVKKFKSYEECTLEQKQKIKEKELADKEILEKILSDETGKYDKPGKIIIPLYDSVFNGLQNKNDTELEIEITQRELAEYGIVPEDINWKTMREAKKEERREARKISSKDIALASKDLTTKDVKGAKGFLTNILDKFKNMFKGKE